MALSTRNAPNLTGKLGAHIDVRFGAAFVFLLALNAPLAAQQAPPSMPGLVVSMPPPQSSGSAPPTTQGVVVSTPPATQAEPAGKPPSTSGKSTSKAPKKRATKTAAKAPAAGRSGPQGIAALVNDELVTAYEVHRLASFMALSANIADRARANMKAIADNPRTNERLKEILQQTIQANPGKSREQVIAAFEARKKEFVISLQKQAVESARASVVPTMNKKALDELIDQRLKTQEAKRLNVTVGDADVDRAMQNIAERNKLTVEQFLQNLKNQGVDPNIMKNRIKTQIIWREVIRKRFGHTINVSNKDIDEAVENAKGGEDTVELQLHKITLASPGKVDQKVLAARLDEAERIRARFQNCRTTSALAKDAPDIKFEDLGYKKGASLPEPTRSLVLNAKEGEMTPANLTAGGVELYAVCNRRTVKANAEKRQAAENELQMKEFERIAQRHLQDLRKDALIEIR